MNQRNVSTNQELNRLLAQLNENGRFGFSVLTDAQGFAVAFAGLKGINAEQQSAIVAMVQPTFRTSESSV